MTNEEVLQDFRRRYQGTFVFLKMEQRGIETLVKVDQVEDSVSKVGVLRLSSDEFGTMTLNIGSEGHSLVFKYPPVGVFQHGGEAYMFRRKPVRQYARGICASNSQMWNVTHSFVGNLTQWSAREIVSAFEGRKFNLGEALELLNKYKTHRSVALHDNFTISKSVFENPEYIIWNWGSPIARCTTKGEVTKVYEEVYTNILKDLR